MDRRVLHSLNCLSLLTPLSWQLELQFSSPDGTADGTGLLPIDGRNTQIESTSPPCCFNNQLPDIHCTLKYIMYVTLKCTLQTLHPFLFQYNHYDLGENMKIRENQEFPLPFTSMQTASIFTGSSCLRL